MIENTHKNKLRQTYAVFQNVATYSSCYETEHNNLQCGKDQEVTDYFMFCQLFSALALIHININALPKLILAKKINQLSV